MLDQNFESLYETLFVQERLEKLNAAFESAIVPEDLEHEMSFLAALPFANLLYQRSKNCLALHEDGSAIAITKVNDPGIKALLLSKNGHNALVLLHRVAKAEQARNPSKKLTYLEMAVNVCDRYYADLVEEGLIKENHKSLGGRASKK